MACTQNCQEAHNSFLIWIHVDDSNIWIEAKKFASRERRFKTREDHRIRIGISKLTDLVADKRPVAQGFLYGSEPPPVDTVWEKIKQKDERLTLIEEVE